jgi:hypothetical protein
VHFGAGKVPGSGFMSPAPELCLVKIVGGGALGVVGSRADRCKIYTT